jgi:hypothetical protein
VTTRDEAKVDAGSGGAIISTGHPDRGWTNRRRAAGTQIGWAPKPTATFGNTRTSDWIAKMAYFPDLAQVYYFPPDCVDSKHLRAVGWLQRGQPFPRGRTSVGFLKTLEHHLRSPWQPVVALGFHTCDLCLGDSRRESAALGVANLWVPSEECVYVAPELIRHYVKGHKYVPPPEFIDALMVCPDQESVEYLARMSRFLKPPMRR